MHAWHDFGHAAWIESSEYPNGGSGVSQATPYLVATSMRASQLSKSPLNVFATSPSLSSHGLSAAPGS